MDDVRLNSKNEDRGEEMRRHELEKEEKEGLKRVLDTVREGGYKRRGGVARGRFSLSDLVDAGNKDEAKRLNLLDEREMLEDEVMGENQQDGEEEEDEELMLEKMLRERAELGMNKETALGLVEDDEEEDDNEDGEEGVEGETLTQEEMVERQRVRDVEKEERMKEKVFRKRANMKRLMGKLGPLADLNPNSNLHSSLDGELSKSSSTKSKPVLKRSFSFMEGGEDEESQKLFSFMKV